MRAAISLAIILLSQCIFTSESRGDTKIPIEKGKFYLSNPGGIKAQTFWDETEHAAVLNASLLRGRFNWSYIGFNLAGNAPETGTHTVQISLKADFPPGLLLTIVLAEEMVSYNLSTPIESNQWGTLTLPLEKFKPSPWNRKEDANHHLDPEACRTALIGFSGTPTDISRPARLWIREVTFK